MSDVLSDFLLISVVFILMAAFTVWFGGWIENNIDETLNLDHLHDEHEENSVG